MERALALHRLRKLFGKEFGYQTDTKALLREEREAERDQYNAAIAAREAASKRLEHMRAEHFAKLKATDEYQAALKHWEEAKKESEHLGGRQMARRFTVGTANRLFFHVEATGDSWEEVFAELKRKGKLK
jgi:hypothetical protein